MIPKKHHVPTTHMTYRWYTKVGSNSQTTPYVCLVYITHW